MSLSRALPLLLALALGACQLEPPPEGYQFGCDSDFDCVAPHTCVSGCCIGEGETPTCPNWSTGKVAPCSQGCPNATCSGDCSNGANCFAQDASGLPGGGCSMFCGCSGRGCCGPNQGCVDVPGLRVQQTNNPGGSTDHRMCVESCDDPKIVCRAGWRCSCKLAPGCYCVPDCTQDPSSCGDPARCDQTTGLCAAPK